MAPLSFRKKNNLECDWNRRQMCRLKRACHSESSREGDARCSCCCCCRATKLTTFFCGGSHEMAASSSPRANPSFKAIGGKRTYYYIPLGVNDHQLFIDHLLYTFNITPYITIYIYIFILLYAAYYTASANRQKRFIRGDAHSVGLREPVMYGAAESP